MDRAKKEARYKRLYVQLQELVAKSDNTIAQMATVSAVLFHKMDYFFWCGFYRIVDNKLIVGPYQGPVACQILTANKGVCWAGINQNKTIVVADVHKFPDHIACDSRSNSEIVVPLRNKENKVVAVLDIDSKDFNSFDEIDAKCLEMIVALVIL